jgi:hypothetical protein
MLTSALITLAQKQFPDWSRTMLLSLLNEIQQMVFTQNCTNQMRMYDDATGKDPLLTTTSGTYEYTIDTTDGFDYDAWRVTDVYDIDINNTSTIDWSAVDATSSVAAKVVFTNDPGVGTYYIRAYRFPTELTTESVQLEVPSSYHISHLLEGLAGFIEVTRSGRSDRWEKFLQKTMPELVEKMNKGNTRSSFTPYRGY